MGVVEKRAADAVAGLEGAGEEAIRIGLMPEPKGRIASGEVTKLRLESVTTLGETTVSQGSTRRTGMGARGETTGVASLVVSFGVQVTVGLGAGVTGGVTGAEVTGAGVTGAEVVDGGVEVVGVEETGG